MKSMIKVMYFIFTTSLLNSCQYFESEKTAVARRLNEKILTYNNEWKGTTIELDSLFNMEGEKVYVDNDYNLLIWYDGDCSYCISQLGKWETYINKFNEGNSKMNVLFYLATDNIRSLKYNLNQSKFPFMTNVIIDEDKVFMDKYDFVMENAFNVILLNQDNKIDFIGSPLFSKKIEEHIYNTISINNNF